MGLLYYDKQKEKKTADEFTLLTEELIKCIKEYMNKGYCPSCIKDKIFNIIIAHKALRENRELYMLYVQLANLPEKHVEM